MIVSIVNEKNKLQTKTKSPDIPLGFTAYHLSFLRKTGLVCSCIASCSVNKMPQTEWRSSSHWIKYRNSRKLILKIKIVYSENGQLPLHSMNNTSMYSINCEKLNKCPAQTDGKIDTLADKLNGIHCILPEAQCNSVVWLNVRHRPVCL